MGFWNRSPSPPSPRRRSSRTQSQGQSYSQSQARVPSRTRTQSTSSKAYASRPSFARSASSFFRSSENVARGRSSYSSSSRVRPRSGLVARVRRFLRKIYEYMKQHPFKVFVFVIMPLITGGALTKLLSRVGVTLPPSLQRVFGSRMNREYTQRERFYARGGARDLGGGSALPGMGMGIGDSLQGAVSIAKMFM